MDLQERWLLFKEKIQQKLQPEQYEGWLEQLELVEVSGKKTIIAGLSHPLFRDDIAKNHDKLFRSLLNEIFPEHAPFNKKKIKYCVGAYQAEERHSVQTEFSFDESTAPAVPSSKTLRQKESSAKTSQKIIPLQPDLPTEFSAFDPKHTLHTFIVGNHNRLAYEAASRILHAPGSLYNPLYIYGAMGLGKTHLMEAIGQAFCQLHNKINVLYVTAESFLNDFVTHIQLKKMNLFRQRYRHVDVILIDNMHNLSGMRSQEEMRHTIETLQKNGKQIIVTSNQLSTNNKEMEATLCSLLESGLTAKIEKPDLETRMKILQSRAKRDRVKIPPEVCYFIAKHIHANVRKMEGALIRLGAHASLLRQEITLEFAKTILVDLLEAPIQRSSQALEEVPEDQIEKVFQKICSLSQVSRAELQSGARSSQVIRARQVSVYLLRKLTNLTLTEIGTHFGNRSHTAISHSLDKISEKMESDEALRLQIQQLVDDLSQEAEVPPMKLPLLK